MRIKAVCFDLYGTLVYVAEPVSEKSVSEFMVSRGYDVYPQALHAAWQYVSVVDYPKYGYSSWNTQIQRVLQRLSVKADNETLKELTRLYENAKWTRFPEVENAVKKAKNLTQDGYSNYDCKIQIQGSPKTDSAQDRCSC